MIIHEDSSTTNTIPMRGDDDDDNTALIQLLSPFGYYSYLGIHVPKSPQSKNNSNENENKRVFSSTMNIATSSSSSSIDEDLVKKNYRRLSLKHHPDRMGGDADTFRVLNRAQHVLLCPTLRREYDNDGGGMDMDGLQLLSTEKQRMVMDMGIEDEINRIRKEQQQQQKRRKSRRRRKSSSQEKPKQSSSTFGGGFGCNQNNENYVQTDEDIAQELASSVYLGFVQLAKRIFILGIMSTVLVRSQITFYPTIIFLGFMGVGIFEDNNDSNNKNNSEDLVEKTIIAFQNMSFCAVITIGLILMHKGQSQYDDQYKSYQEFDSTFGLSEIYNKYVSILQFWLGESLILGLLTCSSVRSITVMMIPRHYDDHRQEMVVALSLMFISITVALWLRGNALNYAKILMILLLSAGVAKLAFPVLKLVLEAELKVKIRKEASKTHWRARKQKQQQESCSYHPCDDDGDSDDSDSDDDSSIFY